MSMEAMIVTVSPEGLRELRPYGVVPAHMTYRMGNGPHLFRAGGPTAPRGGMMALDCRSFNGLGTAQPFCQEVLQECTARGFTGLVCDFEVGGIPPLEAVVEELDSQLARRGWTLLVPESYGHCCRQGLVMISSALSGGSLGQRLAEAQSLFGQGRIALFLERVAEDFYLPSPNGGGVPITWEELQRRIQERNPSIFFSYELCARYFTYMSRDSGAHFVLFDDCDTMRKKLEIARSLDIQTVVARWTVVAPWAKELGLLRPAAPGGGRRMG